MTMAFNETYRFVLLCTTPLDIGVLREWGCLRHCHVNRCFRKRRRRSILRRDSILTVLRSEGSLRPMHTRAQLARPTRREGSVTSQITA